jgi:hypothetical protein
MGRFGIQAEVLPPALFYFFLFFLFFFFLFSVFF